MYQEVQGVDLNFDDSSDSGASGGEEQVGAYEDAPLCLEPYAVDFEISSYDDAEDGDSLQRPPRNASSSVYSSYYTPREDQDRTLKERASKDGRVSAWRYMMDPLPRDWNTEYQELREGRETFRLYEQLQDLAYSFVSTARMYGRIIITEQCLPVEHKTIKPCDLGGVAGGEKFICHGILFKFAADTQFASGNWLYGGHEKSTMLAMKAASQELKNVIALTHVIENSEREGRLCDGIDKAPLRLCTSLMVLVDYCGFRLVAVPLLPLSGGKLVYGSDDGGNTVHNSDEGVSEAMKEVLGNSLGLREHVVGAHAFDSNNVSLYGPGDLEVHVGTDNRVYVLDLARLLPPQAPEPPNLRSIYYQYLRCEYMFARAKRGDVPLSSDAFSGWAAAERNSKEHNRDVFNASQNLVLNEIPRVAAHLRDVDRSLRYVRGSIFFRLDNSGLRDDDALFCLLSLFSAIEFHLTLRRRGSELCAFLHREGLNIRHIGLLRSTLKKYRGRSSDAKEQERLDHYITELLLEGIARSMKDLLCADLREALNSAHTASRVRQVIVKFWNDVIGGDKMILHAITMSASEKFVFLVDGQWNDGDGEQFSESTPVSDAEEETSERGRIFTGKWDGLLSLRDSVARCCDLASITLSGRVLEGLVHQRRPQSPAQVALVGPDVAEVGCRVRHTNVMDRAEAVLHFYAGVKRLHTPSLHSPETDKQNRSRFHPLVLQRAEVEEAQQHLLHAREVLEEALLRAQVSAVNHYLLGLVKYWLCDIELYFLPHSTREGKCEGDELALVQEGTENLTRCLSCLSNDPGRLGHSAHFLHAVLEARCTVYGVRSSVWQDTKRAIDADVVEMERITSIVLSCPELLGGDVETSFMNDDDVSQVWAHPLASLSLLREAEKALLFARVQEHRYQNGVALYACILFSCAVYCCRKSPDFKLEAEARAWGGLIEILCFAQVWPLCSPHQDRFRSMALSAIAGEVRPLKIESKYGQPDQLAECMYAAVVEWMKRDRATSKSFILEALAKGKQRLCSLAEALVGAARSHAEGELFAVVTEELQSATRVHGHLLRRAIPFLPHLEDVSSAPRIMTNQEDIDSIVWENVLVADGIENRAMLGVLPSVCERLKRMEVLRPLKGTLEGMRSIVHASRLRDVTFEELTTESVQALSEAGILPSVERVRVERSSIDDDSVMKLLRACPHTKVFEFAICNALTSAFLQVLPSTEVHTINMSPVRSFGSSLNEEQCAAFAGIRRLSLSGWDIEEDSLIRMFVAMKEILESISFNSIRHFGNKALPSLLSTCRALASMKLQQCNGMVPEAWEQSAEGSLVNLRSLGFGGSMLRLSTAGLGAFLRTSGTKMVSLDISGCKRLDGQALRGAVEVCYETLEELNVSHTSFSSADYICIRTAKNLRVLEFEGATVKEGHIIEMLRPLHKLEEVRVPRNFNDAALQQLAETCSGTLRQIRTNVGTKVTNASIRHLHRCTQLQNIPSGFYSTAAMYHVRLVLPNIATGR